MHCMNQTHFSGGISVISHKYAKSNNRYLEDYDPNEEESYILYLDAKYVFKCKPKHKI